MCYNQRNCMRVYVTGSHAESSGMVGLMGMDKPHVVTLLLLFGRKIQNELFP